jgi:hypothetical protein
MTRCIAAAVFAATRAWLRVYTSHTADDVGVARRAEIESDLWEMEHDTDFESGARLAWLATRRLVTSIPDDVVWRFENLALDQQLIVRRLVAVSAATLMVLSLWAMPSLFLNGRREIANCAATVPDLQTDTDLRLELMRCVGVFFSARSQ